MAKSTSAQHESHIIEVSELLMKGHTRSTILTYCSSNYSIGRSGTDDLIAAANERIAEINDGKIEQTQALILQGLWRQYRNADLAGKHSDCINALKEIAKLKGLDQSTIHLKVDRPLANVDGDDLNALLEESDDI